MVPLAPSDKKLLKAISSFPWPEDLTSPLDGPLEEAEELTLSDVLNSYVSLENQLLASIEPCRRHLSERVAAAKLVFPTTPEAHLREMQFDWALELERGAEAGIARRFLLDDPGETIRFAVAGTRFNWVVLGHGRQGCAQMWGDALVALAIGDDLALERLLTTLPSSLPDDEPTYPFSPWTTHLYNAVFGVLHGDRETALRASGLLQTARVPEYEAAIGACTQGVLDHSLENVAAALERRARCVRKIPTLNPHLRLFDILLHGMYGLCRRIDPDLTRLWNTERALPWDRELHEWVQSGGDLLQGVDLDSLPERCRIHLTEMRMPEWWSSLTK